MYIPAIDCAKIKTCYFPESFYQRQSGIDSFEKTGFSAAGFANQVGELAFTQFQFYVVQHHQSIGLLDVRIRKFDNNRHNYNKLPGYKILHLFARYEPFQGVFSGGEGKAPDPDYAKTLCYLNLFFVHFVKNLNTST